MNSRQKGKRREREFASYLRDQGFSEAKRGQQHSGSPDSPDVVGLPGWHVEVKGCEKAKLRDWVAQAAGDAGAKPWVIAHRWNSGPWLAVVRMDDFIDLVRETMSPAVSQLGELDKYEQAIESIGQILKAVGWKEGGSATESIRRILRPNPDIERILRGELDNAGNGPAIPCTCPEDPREPCTCNCDICRGADCDCT